MNDAWKFEYEERRKAAADAEYVESTGPQRYPVSIEVDGINTRDYPDFCDAFISYAEWSDTGEPLTDEELDELNEDSGFVYEQVQKRIY